MLGHILWWSVLEEYIKKPNACTVCNSPVLFKEKQLTWRPNNWTTKPQQGERNGLKDELGGMSYPSLCWLLGAENVYWYRDPGERNKDIWFTGPGGLQICYWKWENMSMNQLQEWKQSQNGFGFVAVSSGNIAVGGLRLHEVRKSTQSFLSSPNGCCCKLRRASRPCGGLNTNKEQHRVVVNLQHVEWEKVSVGQGERRKMDGWMTF